jgi:hypothetical protein
VLWATDEVGSNKRMVGLSWILAHLIEGEGKKGERKRERKVEGRIK